MTVIELASYPKSGNTWMRRIVEDFVFGLTGKKILTGDIHQIGRAALDDEKSFQLPPNPERYLVYKSHKLNNQLAKPDKVLNICRNPLDVFLSAINFQNLMASRGKLPIDQRERFFLNGEPKSLEEIVRDRELDFYFDDFFENAGARYWPGMLGEESNYFAYQRKVQDLQNCKSIKYEDLLNDFEATVRVSLCFMFGTSGEFGSVNRDRVDEKTKNSGDGFFWKAKSENFREFLSESQIRNFAERYSDELSSLGYNF